MGHLLTRSGLKYSEVSSKVCHDSFYQLGNSVSLPWVIYYEAFSLHVVPWDLPVVKIYPEWVTGPEQGKSSSGIAAFSLWTGTFRDGISSIPGEIVIPMWLGRDFLVCENRVYHEKVGMTHVYVQTKLSHYSTMPNTQPQVWCLASRSVMSRQTAFVQHQTNFILKQNS